MVTRGLRVLISLPLLIAGFVAGSLWLSTHEVTGQMVAVPPNQVVLDFLHALHTGHTAGVVDDLTAAKRGANLPLLGTLLRAQFGTPITTTTAIITRSPTQALVLSDTHTTLGQHYVIEWMLQREGQRWVISDFGSLKVMVPDICNL